MVEIPEILRQGIIYKAHGLEFKLTAGEEIGQILEVVDQDIRIEHNRPTFAANPREYSSTHLDALTKYIELVQPSLPRHDAEAREIRNYGDDLGIVQSEYQEIGTLGRFSYWLFRTVQKIKMIPWCLMHLTTIESSIELQQRCLAKEISCYTIIGSYFGLFSKSLKSWQMGVSPDAASKLEQCAELSTKIEKMYSEARRAMEDKIRTTQKLYNFLYPQRT